MQENIKIGEIVVPTIKDGDETWYPISYINKNFFERDKVGGKALKQYMEYINKKIVNYTYLTGTTNIQEVNCISHKGLVEWIGNRRISKMNLSQKKKYNWIREYLGLDTVIEKSRFCYGFDKVKINKQSNINQEILKDYFSKNEHNQKLQLCSVCGDYFPFSGQFFIGSEIRGLQSTCIKCHGVTGEFSTIGTKYTDIYDVFGEEGFGIYIRGAEYKHMKIYRHYVDNYDIYKQNKLTPHIICEKTVVLELIKALYDNDEIGIDELKLVILRDQYKFDFVDDLTVLDIHKYIFGKDCICYIWKYPCLVSDLNSITIYDAKIIFNNYLNENNIQIKNALTFNYRNIISECGICKFIDEYGLYEFIRDIHENKYGVYEFKQVPSTHWEKKSNRVYALEHLISKYIDNLKDVPLMLSIRYLRDISPVLYRVYSKHYNTLFEWVSECCPDQFTEMDFNIHKIKGNFESIEEKQVDFIMKKHLVYPENLIHNDQKFHFKGFEPDWLYYSEKPFIIEYYGLHDGRYKENSVIVSDYIKRHDSKMEVYEKLENYNILSIYPNDLKNNYEGLKNKIKILDDSTL